jgi:hypothetical protein
MDCKCRKCWREKGDGIMKKFGIVTGDLFMMVCETCGNKRCPHANDHRNACTGSNDIGQAGSTYLLVPNA